MGWQLLAAISAALLIAAGPAHAEEPAQYPNVSGEIGIEVQGDFAADSDDPALEGHDVYTTTEPDVRLSFTRQLYARMHLVLEPMTDREPDENRVFEDHGLFIEDLYLGFEGETFSALGGKFTPNFGTAWDVTPGVYGTDFAEDYEFTERLGGAGGYTFEIPEAGAHTLSAGVFTLDTVLNHSLGKSRGTLGIDAGGPANTEKLNSWVVALDGDLPLPGDIHYHLGFIDQAKPHVGGGKNELGFAAGTYATFDLGSGFSLLLNGEVVRFANADNVDGQDRTYFTGGASLGYRGWNVSLAHTSRLTNLPMAGEEDLHDRQTQVSFGYAFDFGLSVDVGYKHEYADRIATDTVGFLLAYTIPFGPEE